MGFLSRRRTAKLLAEIEAEGLAADRWAHAPLATREAQALREGAERRLEDAAAPLHPAWAQLAVDLTNLHESVSDSEKDAWAFTDALLVGYYVRATQRAQDPSSAAEADEDPRPDRADDPIAAAQDRLALVRELAARPAAGSGLDEKVWEDVRFWARCGRLSGRGRSRATTACTRRSPRRWSTRRRLRSDTRCVARPSAMTAMSSQSH